mgnify:CR=1 FL=1
MAAIRVAYYVSKYQPVLHVPVDADLVDTNVSMSALGVIIYPNYCHALGGVLDKLLRQRFVATWFFCPRLVFPPINVLNALELFRHKCHFRFLSK